MSIVPSFIGLRDPLASLFAKSGAQPQSRTMHTGPEQVADDVAAKAALKEMQVAQHALRQIERLDSLLQPIA